MASEVLPEVARVDRDDPILAQLRQDGTARLRFSQPLIDLLDELSIRLNTPVVDLMTHALALFKLAADAQSRGESVCFVDDDLDIVGEIADFAATKGVGVASYTDAESDQDEQ